MAEIYIAINGDEVGTTIGQHIAADDHENLQAASGAVKQGHQMIGDWVEQQGGQEVTSSGDEGIYIIPEETLDQLEDIRSQYQESAGHNLTIGIGSSMSEASKALIYGKLNGKNQIVEYDPSIESLLSGKQKEDIEENDESVPIDDKTPEEDNLEEPTESLDEEELDPELTEELDPDMGEESLDDGEEEESLDEEELTDGTVEDQGEVEGDGDTTPPSDEIEDDETVYDDLTETDDDPEEEMPGEEFEEEMPDEESEEGGEAYDYNDGLTDMIHSHMEGDDAEPGMEEGEESPEDIEEGDDGDLKSDIATALMAFRENKEMLEAAREQNPKLYEATITMLRSMIDMAKKLGYSPDQDMANADAEEELVENFPDAEPEEGMEEGQPPPQPQSEPTAMEEGEEEAEEPEKKPKGRGQ